MKYFYNTRVVRAKNKKGAISKIEDGDFIESHPLSDKVLTKEELSDIRFPNGFTSWQETHFHVVTTIADHVTKEYGNSQVTLVQEIKGQGGLWELAEDLTNKFESENKGREWDGDYFDELDAFLDNHLIRK